MFTFVLDHEQNNRFLGVEEGLQRFAPGIIKKLFFNPHVKGKRLVEPASHTSESHLFFVGQPGDIAAITHLYADGNRRGEAPDFFDRSMVERGI